MKYLYILMGFMVLLLAVGSARAAPIAVTGCGTLATMGGYYSLSNNFNTDADPCIVIGADNITFEGNGKFIDGAVGADTVFSLAARINTTIRNVITNTSGNHRCVWNKASNNTYINNINCSSPTYIGVDIYDDITASASHHFTMVNSNTTSAYAVELIYNSSFNDFHNNIFQGGSGYCIKLGNAGSDHTYNTIYNNWFNCTTTIATGTLNNTFDNGVTGNYWGNPSLTGFSDTCADLDGNGICDTPYGIYLDGVDLFPKNKTNFTSTTAAASIKIVNPTNTTYYTSAIILNVSNNTIINTFWFEVNGTNTTFSEAFKTPNATYNFPSTGVFNLTVYGNSSDGLTNYTDTVFFTIKSFAIVSEYSETWVLETKNTKYNISIYDYYGLSQISANIYINGTYRGYTSYINSGNYWNFTYIGIPAYLQGEINETAYDITWEVKINGSFLSSTTTNVSTSQKVSRLRLLRCAAPMLNNSIFFNITDEDSTTKKIVSTFQMATVSLYVDSGYRNYSFDLSGDADYRFCLFPGWTYANMNATVKYHNDSYEDRWWWSETTNLSNSTQTVNLYSINTSANFITPTFSILNLFQVPQSGVIVKFLRWFVGEDVYRQVATMKTGTEGIGEVPLLPNNQYRYVLERGGKVLNIVGPELLPSTMTSKELYTESGSFSQFWKYHGKIGGSCYNTTTLITCNYVDLSGLVSYVKLNGNALKQLNNSDIICANTSAASAGYIFCDISGFENRTITLSLVATLNDGTSVLLWVGTIEGAAPLLQLGNYGLFAAFLIIIAMALIGLSRQEIGIAGSVVLAYMGVVVSTMFGLIVINQTILVGLGFGTAVVAYILARESR